MAIAYLCHLPATQASIIHPMASTLLFIGTPEIMVILLVIVLLFGAKGIPDIARTFGSAMRQFKDATNEIQRDIEQGAKDIKDEVDIKKHIED